MSINEKFIINLQGKSYVTYEGLLDLAHQHNLKSLEVELIQIPTKENNMTAICKATATTEDKIYTDIGDASPQSVNNTIAPHLIRMASTRAKARVLRDLTNVGMTAVEEISYNEETSEYNEPYIANEEPPTKRQLETLKKLADELNIAIDYENLTKRTAGNLISKMLDEVKKA
ncbi:hypothetical protein EDD65_10814 [Keratinibaculum paraultunense]|uniref:Uncharacterized protein n=1 Tax=Keratinibaculum paraultunense TaxID=1278232 RepID=A0A4V2UU02_9FIRM|nr:hypothetical protein [Keratinibaculum paraultunense]QQY79101.1 hypothetical protein JL105_07865 [Keratinibaculum paraultunense]TCS88482.1 hypothetical protein EDD65_10814 [Keratinibaculum paraultunense]